MTGGTAVLNNTGDDVYLVSNRTLPAVVVHAVTYPATVGEGAGLGLDPQRVGQLRVAHADAVRQQRRRRRHRPAGHGGRPRSEPGCGSRRDPPHLDRAGRRRGRGHGERVLDQVAHDPITAGTSTRRPTSTAGSPSRMPLAGGAAETLYVSGLDPDSTWHFALQGAGRRAEHRRRLERRRLAPAGRQPARPRPGLQRRTSATCTRTSSYSDGVQTPADAYAFARLAAPTPLDFLAVTDHNHSARECTRQLRAGGGAGRRGQRRRQLRRDLGTGVGHHRQRRPCHRARGARALRLGAGQLRRVRRRGRLHGAVHGGAGESRPPGIRPSSSGAIRRRATSTASRSPTTARKS